MDERLPIITFRDIHEPGAVGHRCATDAYDEALERLGGGGQAGHAFRDRALKAAGWDFALGAPVTDHPERVARSYMIIRAVLMKSLDPLALIDEINFVRAIRDI